MEFQERTRYAILGGTVKRMQVNVPMIIALSATDAISANAVEGFLKALPLEGDLLRVNAGEEDQVFGFAGLLEGARTKARHALDFQKADMGIGIENGLVQLEGNGWFDFLCVAVRTKDGRESVNFSGGFSVPDWIVREMKEKNAKLSTIIRRLSRGNERDPLRYFSKGMLAREDSLRSVMLGALSKIVHREQYHF